MAHGYIVTIEFDPTAPRGMRWTAVIRDGAGRYVTTESCCFSRKSAERKVDRYIGRLPSKRSYTYHPKGLAR